VNRKRIIAALAIAGAGAFAFVSPSSAAPSVDPAGNITIIKAGPRVVAAPGATITPAKDSAIKVAGETFGDDTVPANASAVLINVSNNQSAFSGNLTVWPAGNGKPGTPTISWEKGEVQTQQVLVPIGADGSISVASNTVTKYLVSILGFVSPESPVAAPVVKAIASTERKPVQVGGSIRLRSTIMGTVTLAPGTYDARVTGSFTGLNNKNNTVPADVNLSGSMVLTASDAAEWTFPALATAATLIPDAKSDTLTQDPTVVISRYITIEKETTVAVRFMGYAGDSSTAGSGELMAGIDSATFTKVG
jgi:hypothetical protein